MKKATIYASLFLLAFGITAGLVTVTYDQAQAYQLCEFECVGHFYCNTHQTGPLCESNPKLPYYKYWVATCIGGPLNCPPTHWVGCCAGLVPIPIDSL